MGLENLSAKKTETPPVDVFNTETLYMRNGRFKASFEDINTLIDGGNTMPAQAMAEGGYTQLSAEQNQEIAKKLVERDITYLMRPERGAYTIQQLMQVVARAGLSPEETMAQIQKLIDAQKKLAN